MEARRTKGTVVRKVYNTIPYDNFTKILKEDGKAFLEEVEPLSRQRIWSAARTLSRLVGKPVGYYKAVMEVDNGPVLEGYIFHVKDETN